MGVIGRILGAKDCRGDLGGGGHRPSCTGPQPEQERSKEMLPASAGAKKSPEQGQVYRRLWKRYDSGGTVAGIADHPRAVQ